jgi:hypothetical protein
MKHEQTTAHDAGKAEVHQRADMPAQQARLLVAETTRRNTPAMKGPRQNLTCKTWN